MSAKRGDGRITVAEVSNSRQAWGAEFAFMALAEPLADRGIDLVLASPPGGDLEEQWTTMGLEHRPLEIPDRQGIRSADGESGPGLGQMVRETGASLRSVRAIAAMARGVDIVNSSSLWTHFDCALAGRLARKPVVLDMHDIVRPGTGRKVLTAAVRLSSCAIAVSHAVADCVGPAGAPHLRIMVPAVDLERFSPGPADPEMRRRLTSAPEDPLVGIVGRIDPEKGIDLLVRAMAGLEGEAARTHVVVVGSPGFDSGSYLERLKADAGRLLGDRARFAGRIEDVPAVLRSLDVLVNASVAEPFGLGVLEAQATGVAVVATRSGGVTDFLADGDNALLVPCGDPEAMTAAIDRVITEPGLAAAMGARGREVAVVGHGVDLFSDGLAELYRELAGRTASPVTAGGGR
ncbi:MAG: glycosyltransferase family 4 protein [Acidimicrobiales bacterium]